MITPFVRRGSASRGVVGRAVVVHVDHRGGEGCPEVADHEPDVGGFVQTRNEYGEPHNITRRGGVGIFVLVRTSNAGGDLQDVVLKDGTTMWHHVASLVAGSAASEAAAG